MTSEPVDDGDVLYRATQALRESPVAEGPNEALIVRTLAAFPAQMDGPRPTLSQRIRSMTWKKKAMLASGIAASAVVGSQLVFMGASFALDHFDPADHDNWFVHFLHHIVMIHHHLLGQ